MTSATPTRTQRILSRVFNHPVLAVIIVIGIVVVGIGSFADALLKIAEVCPGLSPSGAPTNTVESPPLVMTPSRVSSATEIHISGVQGRVDVIANEKAPLGEQSVAAGIQAVRTVFIRPNHHVIIINTGPQNVIRIDDRLRDYVEIVDRGQQSDIRFAGF